MSNDFEIASGLDHPEFDHPDAEEPQTWQHAQERSDAEIDAVDWADQRAIVDDSQFDEDAPASGDDTFGSSAER